MLLPPGTNTSQDVEMSTLEDEARQLNIDLARSRSRGKSISANDASTRDFTIGIMLILVVVVLWTTSNFVTQYLFEGGYEKPFLVTYLQSSAFSFYLVVFLLRKLWRQRRVNNDDDDKVTRRGSSTVEYQPLISGERGLDDYVTDENGNALAREDLPLTTKETAHLAFAFCFLWLIANWTVNASLDYTSVASATILTTMSSFFTLGIGYIFKVEKLTMLKIGAVFISFMGVILVSLSDSSSKPIQGTDHSSRPLLGDSLALLSALCYALYVTLLKVRIRMESRINMLLFFGFVGLFNLLTCWPIGVILHLTGVEVFELPQTGNAWGAIVLNIFITLSSDYLYVLAMLKTTPLVVTIGLSLTIPVAVIGDFFLKRPSKGQVIFGAALVLFSFIAVGVGSEVGQVESPNVVDATDEVQDRGDS